jgi:hypothetical protein
VLRAPPCLASSLGASRRLAFVRIEQLERPARLAVGEPSQLDSLARLDCREGRPAPRIGPTDLAQGQPRDDPPDGLWCDCVVDDATIDARWKWPDESRLSEESELSADGRRRQPDLPCNARWPPYAERKNRDDPTSCWVREELDPATVPLRHRRMVHDASYRPINRRCHGRRALMEPSAKGTDGRENVPDRRAAASRRNLPLRWKHSQLARRGMSAADTKHGRTSVLFPRRRVESERAPGPARRAWSA